jgi:pyruvate dehydrogenase E2 component (dihydrolipoamide acetyltransferase)
MAQEVGLDVVALAKEKGVAKLDRTDIEAAIAERRTLPTQPTLSVLDERISVTHIRRLIADRMVESLQTSAQITLTTEADASALVALRQQLKMALESREMPVPSYNDLLIRLTALALKQHPLLNATWNATEIILHKDIGLAVDTEDGLLAPVIRNADAKSVQQIAAETRNLIAKARSRQISAGDLNNGTFTISNLGMYNIDAFTPVINLPQCAILGIGRIVKKPAVVGNQVTVREMIVLSLTFDHRIVDGGPAARFFNQIREYIEEPVLWLVA